MSDIELVSDTESRYMDLLRIEKAENRDMEIRTRKGNCAWSWKQWESPLKIGE